MALLLKNNAYSQLAASLTDIATSLTVTTGHGNRFPIAANPDYFKITLQDAANNIEIVKVTARANNADTMTIERAQEGTVARAWNIGDIVELRITAGISAPLGVLAEAATAADIRTAIGAFASAGGSISGNTDITGTLQVIGNLSYTGTLTGGTGVVNIGSGQIYKDAAGLVGIGNATPGRQLSVGSAGAVTTIQVTNSVTGSAAGDGGIFQMVNSDLVVSNQEAGSLQLGTAGGTRFTIDSAGNAGLGVTPSAWGTVKSLDISTWASFAGFTNQVGMSGNAYFDGSVYRYKQTAVATRYEQNNSGSHFWFTAPSGTAGDPITFTQAMTLTQGGNLLVGTTTDTSDRIRATDGSGNMFITGQSIAQNRSPNSGAVADAGAFSQQITLGTGTGAIQFFTSGAVGGAITERGRFTSGGYFKATNNGQYLDGASTPNDATNTASHFFYGTQDGPNLTSSNRNTGSSVFSFMSDLVTGSAGFHFVGRTNITNVIQILANGNVQNTNNSYGPISDVKLKENIADAPSFLDRFMQLRFVTYNLKESLGYNPEKQLGWIAQEVEQVFPSLVYDNIDTEQVTKTRIVEVPAVLDEEGNEVTPATTREEEYTESVPTGTVTKALKASIISVIQGKVIQEQQAIIEQQGAVLADLLARVAALEAQ